MKYNKAFTLAEVLITLGIIGIVVAMTMPALIQNYKKHVVETQLKHFYSQINQAIKMSELNNGAIEDWDTIPNTQNVIIDWTNKYLTKYIKFLKTEKCLVINITALSQGSYNCGCIIFNNGSGVAIHKDAWFFYPNVHKFNKAATCGTISHLYLIPANNLDVWNRFFIVWEKLLTASTPILYTPLSL